MNRADSMPSFSPLPFRERAGTTGPMVGSPGGRDGLTKSKLAALLGEEVQEMPTEEGIVFMRDKETDQVLIRGGTLDALISKLITAESEGKAYTDSFLIAYRSFIEPPALFEKLQAQYEETFHMAPGPDGRTMEQDRMRPKILTPQTRQGQALSSEDMHGEGHMRAFPLLFQYDYSNRRLICESPSSLDIQLFAISA